MSTLTLWPVYDTLTQEYIHFDAAVPAFATGDHYAATRMNFWNALVPVLMEGCDVDCETCDESSSSDSDEE